MPGTLKLAVVVDVIGFPSPSERGSGLKVTGPGPRYWIQRTDKPPEEALPSSAFRCLRGLGRPSSCAVTVNVTVFPKLTVCGPLPVITGASFSGSVVALVFSIMTSSLISQSGWSHPFAVLVLPRMLKFHTTLRSKPQSLGTTTLKTNNCRRG